MPTIQFPLSPLQQGIYFETYAEEKKITGLYNCSNDFVFSRIF